MEKNNNKKTEVESKNAEASKPELMVYLGLYNAKSTSIDRIGCRKHQLYPCIECLDG